MVRARSFHPRRPRPRVARAVPSRDSRADAAGPRTMDGSGFYFSRVHKPQNGAETRRKGAARRARRGWIFRDTRLSSSGVHAGPISATMRPASSSRILARS
mmetsp:Transcript_105/g.380  ORF Transcript_105/g.380 Transcript_105/m.380 type:complete len:101 (+) Transcript_105:22-324(+)